MYKLKTKNSVKKRFRITNTGKVLRKQAFKSHILEKQTTKKKRQLSLTKCASKADSRIIKSLLPYN
jgi:large subunit ribosomal protein L35